MSDQAEYKEDEGFNELLSYYEWQLKQEVYLEIQLDNLQRVQDMKGDY